MMAKMKSIIRTVPTDEATITAMTVVVSDPAREEVGENQECSVELYNILYMCI